MQRGLFRVDFKGNPTSEERQLVSGKTTRPDWSALLGQTTIAQMASAAASLLDSEVFEASTERDALNRVFKAISPDDSEVLYTYDEGGALQKVEVKHRGSSTAQTVVGEITYNARGQRESVTYGPTSSPTSVTSYTYDPETYRLASVTTERDSDNADLQALSYHYDPVGNVTDIRDAAQQTVYFQNSVVEAANSYTYDAVYRLVEATGSEHSSQGTTQRTDVQLVPGAQPMTSDPSAMRRYTQEYTYDEVGNILTMKHIPASGTGWTRYYEYDANGNQLDKTSAPGDPANGPYTHLYTYDAHGSMLSMPHISSMVWNYDDELQKAVVGTESVYFQYAGGMRSRKYVEKSGSTTEERIYLGPFEIYRKRINGTLDLERESLHISDGSGRICVIETKTVFNGSAVGSPTGIWRYQLSNHLGSATTESDASGAIISYEEYHPYGTSAYRAVDASVDVSAKRYRYTGMERDEETSLEYHSARYYAPWLGRWTAADPIGTSGGINRYSYVEVRPTSARDLTGLIPPIPYGEGPPRPSDAPPERLPWERTFTPRTPDAPPLDEQIETFIDDNRSSYGMSKEVESIAAGRHRNDTLRMLSAKDVRENLARVESSKGRLQAAQGLFATTSLGAFSSGSDLALVLTIGARESGNHFFSNDRSVHRFSSAGTDAHLAGVGGLDNLFKRQGAFRKAGLYIEEVEKGETWEESVELGWNPRRSQEEILDRSPAWIRKSDLPFAYMTEIANAEKQFKEVHVPKALEMLGKELGQDLAMTGEEIDTMWSNLSVGARRAWIQAEFSGPSTARNIALDIFRHQSASEQELDLDAILSVDLDVLGTEGRQEVVGLGRAVALRAAAFERFMQ